MHKEYDIVILGGGPAGYTAAFRAADILGCDKKNPKIALIEKNPDLGGVCLHEGCIPSKSLLHLAYLKEHIQLLEKAGYALPSSGLQSWDLEKLRKYQLESIKTLASGLSTLSVLRNIDRITGFGSFVSQKEIKIFSETDQAHTITFSKAIIATGSQPRTLGFLNKNPKVWDAKKALELNHIPEKLIIIGGGVIGFEMAQIYHALGSAIVILESSEHVLKGVDKDLANILIKNLKSKHITIVSGVQIQNITEIDTKLVLEYKKDGALLSIEGDILLESVGRAAALGDLGLDHAGIHIEKTGFIKINTDTMQTSCENIYAIGDVSGGPLLAHKAIAQGKIAAEHACGLKVKFEPKSIVSVIYTDPEVAWIGPTEEELNHNNTPYKTAVFPWKANGRAIATSESEGLTKVIYRPDNHRILAGGICGAHGGDLIGELILAVEMGAFLEDLALSIHPHPSTSETIANACEIGIGTITELLPKK